MKSRLSESALSSDWQLNRITQILISTSEDPELYLDFTVELKLSHSCLISTLIS